VTTTDNRPSPDEARAAVASNPLWYHTIEVAPGVVTPGWFDLRPVVSRIPWPDVRGKRCLDVGTYDGWVAFELERRGAAEVTATDVGGHEGWDWPPHLRQRGPEFLAEIAGQKGRGFEIAHELLGSKVEKTVIDVYDLSPETIGQFDVVVCGSLLLHLRDPLRALDAIRSVCKDTFLSMEQVELELSLLARRVPIVRLEGTSERLQWWLPTVQAHVRMLETMGFAVDRRSGLYCEPVGPGFPRKPEGWRGRAQAALQKRVCGNSGNPHHAALTRRAI
jgi:tRNA (mo5U34)-methyltransferase